MGTKPTSLYAKVFIDGFSKPSYIVFTIHLSGSVEEAAVREATLRLVERHPLLRSKVERSPIGVPVRFRDYPVSAWVSEGSLTSIDGFDFSTLHAFEQGLLSEPLDPVVRFPFQGWILRGEIDGRPACTLIAKAHHAIIDASSGKVLMLGFAEALREALGGAPRAARSSTKPARAEAKTAPTPPWQRLRDWFKDAELSARVPDVSVLADFKPNAPLPRLLVGFAERAVPMAEFERLRDRAHAARLTFSQLLCAALLRAMHVYNKGEIARRPGTALPSTLGLMIAVSRRWGSRAASQELGFDADTRVLNVASSLLEPGSGEADLHAAVREGLGIRRGGHNDVALGLLYASRWASALAARVRGAHQTIPEPVREIHLTLSDLTGGATRLPRAMDLTPDLRIERVRYLVSPVAPAHGGLIASISGDDLRFTLLYHEGALRADDLFDALFAELSIDSLKAAPAALWR